MSPLILKFSQKICAFTMIFVLFTGLLAPTAIKASNECEKPLNEIISSKDFALAYYCSELRLNTNPNDVTAMLVAARAAQELGQLDIALELARGSRQHSLTKSQLFASYLISGVAASGNGQGLTSKILLRRASNYAQNEIETRLVGAAIAQVRSQSPWSYGLSFNATPSTNVNGGTIIYNPLDSVDARAQPGVGYGLNGNITYRTRVSERVLWENRLHSDVTIYDGLGQNNYNIGYSSSLRYQPNSRIPVLLVARFAFDNRGLADELGGAAFGAYSPYYSQSTFSLESHIIPRKDHVFRVSGSFTAREYVTRGAADVFRGGMSYGFPLSDGISASISGYYENTDSPYYFIAKKTKSVSIGLLFDLESLPVSLSTWVSASVNHYPLPYFIEGFRDDKSVTLDIGLTPKNLQWFGFRPTFGVNLSENISTIDRFTTDEIRVYTRISSVF